MDATWRRKPGDLVFRARRVKRFPLRRVLGIPALFSAGYGDVGSSIYYALGIVAIVALGATPIALGVAGIIFIFTALTYAEGSAMLPEGGGAATFARHGFNDLGSFIGGWALMLSYITTIAVSAYTVPPYLAHFWPALNEPAIGTTTAMGIIFFLMLLNIIGVRESSTLNIVFIAIDIITQLVLVVAGVTLIFWVNPGVLWQNMFGAGNWPTTPRFVFGIALAALAFTGVETISQMAQEAKRPIEQIPKAYMLMIVTVLILFTGISVVALAAMTPQVLGDPVHGWAKHPVAGIAANLPSETLRSIFAPLVAILAATILVTGANAGLIGVSRLAYTLSFYQQLPAAFSKVHARFRTPHIAIFVFCVVTLVLMIPGFFFTRFFVALGALYAFGSLLSFAVAHAAILALRIRRPDLSRPFRLRGNIKIQGHDLPISAILGLISTTVVWVVLTSEGHFIRIVGLTWMAVGLLVYYVYRRRKHLSLTHINQKPVTAPSNPRK